MAKNPGGCCAFETEKIGKYLIEQFFLAQDNK